MKPYEEGISSLLITDVTDKAVHLATVVVLPLIGGGGNASPGASRGYLKPEVLLKMSEHFQMPADHCTRLWNVLGE